MRRNSTNKAIKEYELQTVTFNTTLVSFLGIRCFQQHVQGGTYSKSCKISVNAFLADDMNGASTIADALDLRNQITKKLEISAFEL